MYYVNRWVSEANTALKSTIEIEHSCMHEYICPEKKYTDYNNNSGRLFNTTFKEFLPSTRRSVEHGTRALTVLG